MRRQRPVPCDHTELEGELREADSTLALALRDSLAELPDGQREVVVLRHVAGWSHAEIAARLERTEHSVHALHHRGRRTLMAGLIQREAAPAAA
jgi:RNA polymerase sigma-70 factor (ECF subfamily)